jgi:hypothetical protein
LEFDMPATSARKTRWHRLAQLGNALREAGYDTTDLPPYGRVWRDAFQGKFSADGKKGVREDALPEVAELYGLAKVA